MLIYQILADLVVVAHFAYVAFIVLGQFAVLYGLIRRRTWARNAYFRCLHLLAIAVVVLQSWLGATCPLTDLERYLRGQVGEGSYPGDFLAYWVGRLLFYQGPSWVFMLAYTVFGILVLVTFATAPPHWRGNTQQRTD